MATRKHTFLPYCDVHPNETDDQIEQKLGFEWMETVQVNVSLKLIVRKGRVLSRLKEKSSIYQETVLFLESVTRLSYDILLRNL